MILFIYDFRISPEALLGFQNWAATKGMKFWESQPGVIRYQTFRKASHKAYGPMLNTLSGDPKYIDVFSEVEVQDTCCLESIINTHEFQTMQQELLEYVEQNSLSHSILQRAYDSQNQPMALQS